MAKGFVTRQVRWSDAAEQLKAIRYTVFVEEQHVPEEEELDEYDAKCMHFLCFDKENTNTPVGCARVIDNGKIGRVAVYKEYRGKGVGVELMLACTRYSVEVLQKTPKLDAQLSALTFYEKLGFVAHGQEFMDAGIPHKHMTYALSSFISSTPSNDDHSSSEHKATDSSFSQHTRHNGDNVTPIRQPVIGYPDVTAQLSDTLSTSRGTLYLCCPELLINVFNADNTHSALSAFFKSHNRNQLQLILDVNTSENLPTEGLLSLAKRLPSRVTIRTLTDETVRFDSVKLLADHHEWVATLENTQIIAHRRRLSDHQFQMAKEHFERMWEHESEDNPNFREVRI
ncbi:GNAT family N-acetyltransferase [Marinibactrum halimedae]|uniref:N-acetyltransferase domain-containing protein n=1 Tax=Marinibactrum halimedae TaxID=1444977 RepID=A0AA37WMW4_9GAMM|nr:GNAT family N-acetyltransferase [Marinibactrum halimedae]MCD9460328.1 GNAT family N-acetyltransferase [Marinibactrum halimedae]GLS26763.1 hypothetical protein GCM10007877_24820 [Marinibactrum halimedae]